VAALAADLLSRGGVALEVEPRRREGFAHAAADAETAAAEVQVVGGHAVTAEVPAVDDAAGRRKEAGTWADAWETRCASQKGGCNDGIMTWQARGRSVEPGGDSTHLAADDKGLSHDRRTIKT